jgi:hypothetical protein
MLCLAVGLGILGALAFAKHRRHCRHGGFYRHHHHGRRGRRRWFMFHTLERLDASPAQERALVAELDQLEERLRTARGNLAALRPVLADAMRSRELDATALTGLEAGFDTVVADARGAITDTLRRVHALLDDRQRATLAELVGGGGWRGGAGPYRA